MPGLLTCTPCCSKQCCRACDPVCAARSVLCVHYHQPVLWIGGVALSGMTVLCRLVQLCLPAWPAASRQARWHANKDTPARHLHMESCVVSVSKLSRLVVDQLKLAAAVFTCTTQLLHQVVNTQPRCTAILLLHCALLLLVGCILVDVTKASVAVGVHMCKVLYIWHVCSLLKGRCC